jgi:hypothetical protein
MKPEDESPMPMSELLYRCLAGQTLQLELIHLLESELEELASRCGANTPKGFLHEGLKKRAAAHVREKARHYADVDPDMATWLARVADEYEKS